MTEALKHFIAGQVRTFRKQRGLRQAGLAEAIGRTSEAISNIERAKSLPALDTLIAIAAALEVPIREFFPDDGATENKSPNRLKLDAEATAIIRGLSDERARIALSQLRALAEA
ncbi:MULTISPECIES: helix-turn-helix transcriptional regulator [Paracoccus]|uniref:helix-turn-helix transcriptional regulator n=1 Tax=Paracoccus TaxID=265 RepID=UPI00112EC3DC|nr:MULTISPECIES: helix-turn-helix transcriptional regulator [Paracoccus]MCJ1901791.1 helix-turn-helix domain-containing protein [Paracoccus versutus]MDF3905770.1 helix-turn-helix transcriptional regulator [Paracoccus sp. AS002]